MATVRPRSWTTKSGEPRRGWQLTYQDTDGKQHRRLFRLKSEADNERIRIEGELAGGLHVPDSKSITVLENAKLWLASVEKLVRAGKRSQVTLDGYTQHVELHMARFDASKVKLSKLTAADCEAFTEDLLCHLSPAMAKKVWTSFRVALNFAVRRNRLKVSPAQAVRLDPGRDQGQSEVQIPSKAALRAILGAARHYDNSGRALASISLFVFAGLRVGEYRALQVNQLHLRGASPEIHVTCSADRDSKIKVPKSNAGNRRIPIGPQTVTALKSWMLARSKVKGAELDLLFPNGAGKIESHTNLYHRFWTPLLVQAQARLEQDPEWSGRELLARRAKVKQKSKSGRRETVEVWRVGYGFHALRHAAASLFIEQGLNPKQLKERMGHASIQLTFDLYGHLWSDPEADQVIARGIEGRVLG